MKGFLIAWVAAILFIVAVAAGIVLIGLSTATAGDGGSTAREGSSFGWLIIGLGGLGLAALAGYGALRLRSRMP
ncbi:MAG: hypothetical protein A3F35_00700 [Candidatus Woykebacteria bacterium RIFCSPHIGHO2_12_FULL_45_10]|uniref:Uncharacterized protein n=1 Tax=Candidatus Woykebacteria bacterium RIFCSPHIGHO2_12_FULL_45_10 TaxID=1802603 RepID=A0A1G1WNI8_9BACT|nr:MAG: hypothetical protein A3F35_00700 [Candidatus Woykebacteria bacterium RIFCSPHIGHO2_12_FULL_45_10]